MSGEKLDSTNVDRITADILMAAIQSKMIGTNTGSDEKSAHNIANAFLIIREAVAKNRNTSA